MLEGAVEFLISEFFVCCKVFSVVFSHYCVRVSGEDVNDFFERGVRTGFDGVPIDVPEGVSESAGRPA
jgi:hypothetical protein